MVRRRNYFIKKKFQLNFLSGFIILLLVEALLTAGLFMYASTDTLTTGLTATGLKVEKTSDFFFVSFAMITFIIVVGMAMAGIVVFILLSHRLAGPLFRFEKALKEIEGGDLTMRVNLRKTDQIIEIKEQFNLLTESLDKRIGNVKRAAGIIESHIRDVDNAELSKAAAALKRELIHFKTTSDLPG